MVTGSPIRPNIMWFRVIGRAQTMASDYLRPPPHGRDHTPPAQAGRSTMAEKGGGGGGERWKAALVNLSEMGTNVESLQKILVKKAVFVDEETFAKASLTSEQARTIKVSAIQKVSSFMI